MVPRDGNASVSGTMLSRSLLYMFHDDELVTGLGSVVLDVEVYTSNLVIEKKTTQSPK